MIRFRSSRVLVRTLALRSQELLDHERAKNEIKLELTSCGGDLVASS